MSFVIVDMDAPPTAFFTVSKDGRGSPFFPWLKKSSMYCLKLINKCSIEIEEYCSRIIYKYNIIKTSSVIIINHVLILRRKIPRIEHHQNKSDVSITICGYWSLNSRKRLRLLRRWDSLLLQWKDVLRFEINVMSH